MNKIVSEILGHSSISITLDTYSHVLPGMSDSLADAMDDAMDQAESPSPPARFPRPDDEEAV